MRKKAIILFVAAILFMSLYGCVQPNKPATSNETNSTQSSATQPVETQGSKNDKGRENVQDPELAYAFKTFILWVPGASYTVENYDAQTSTLYTSAGTVPKSTITIKRDGTYVWNQKKFGW